MNKTIRALALAIGLIATPFLVGCRRSAHKAPVRVEDPTQKAMRILGARSSEDVYPIGNGYTTLKDIYEWDLSMVAGVKAGTARVNVITEKTQKPGYAMTTRRYSSEGGYSRAWHPEALDEACREADTNGD